MKKAKTILLCCLCAVVLVTGSVMGTLAYLTSRDKVTNTFTVGNVAIILDEADVDEDGTPIQGAQRVKENEYHLIPGQTYTKDPTVTVKAKSEESYIRMLVTINCYSQLKAILGDDFLPENYIDGTWDSALWPCVASEEDAANNTITYEFRYATAVDASESNDDIALDALFTQFTLPGEITGEELQTIENLTITVEGHAIQTAGFASVDEAWAAFDVQYSQQNP